MGVATADGPGTERRSAMRSRMSRLFAPLAAALLTAALLTMAAGMPDALAQSRVVEDVVVEQSRIIERFSPPPVKGSASITVPVLVEPMPPELADRPAFVLRRVRIEGATELGVDDLRPLWSGMI